jgi:hypothetical protein
MPSKRKLVALMILAVSLVAASALAIQKYAGFEKPNLFGFNSVSAPGSPGCACCSKNGASRGDGPGLSPLEAAKRTALEYYSARYGDRDVAVEVKDFGCHMEAYILKNGTVVKRLNMANGNIDEIA